MKRGSRTPFGGGWATLAPPTSADWFLDHVHFTGPWCPHIPCWPDPCLGLFLSTCGLHAAWIRESRLRSYLLGLNPSSTPVTYTP